MPPHNPSKDIMTMSEDARPWPGASLLNGGKGYASTPMGQVHYRDLGQGNAAPPILLLHQTPMSMIEYGAIQTELEGLGVRSIAIDTPGYGLSDHPEGDPSIEDFADNLVPVLDHLKIEKTVLAGHHTGSSIACAFAARHSQRSLGVILHGSGVFTPADAAMRLGLKMWDMVPREDASHLRTVFDFRVRTSGGKPLSAGEMAAATWMTMGLVLQSRDIGHPASFRYDMAADLKKITVPGLILTDRRDSIHHLDKFAAQVRPDFDYVELSDQGHWFMMHEPQRWAKIAAEFLAQIHENA